MIDLTTRLRLLAAFQDTLEPWLGKCDDPTLRAWVTAELGDVEVMDRWVNHGDAMRRALPFSPLLHVISGNTPHAAFQSIVRGLVVGAHNWLKLPGAGLPEVEAWLAKLPPELASLVEVRHDWRDDWNAPAAAVVFGGAGAIRHFRSRLEPGTRIIEHGPKLSIAVIFDEAGPTAAEAVCADILRFEQRGCLSVQAVYVAAPHARSFAQDLAHAMTAHRARFPRPDPLTLSEAGAIANLRELLRFRQANGDDIALYESPNSTAWTVVYDGDPTLQPGPLNGFVRVHPLPPVLNGQALGSESREISSVALHPMDAATLAKLDALAPPRICALGQAQDPGLFWDHDGRPPLADLVHWRNLSGTPTSSFRH